MLLLGALAFLSTLLLLAHHAISHGRRRRHSRSVEQATALLAEALVTGKDLLPTVEQARLRFGARAVADVLRRARTELKGKPRAEISRALVELGEVSRLERGARSRRDWIRVEAIRGLAECGGELARAVLLEGTRDQAFEVRRAARDGLLSEGTPESIGSAIRSYFEESRETAGWKRTFYARLASVDAASLRRLVASGQLEPAEEKAALETLGEARDAETLPLARARVLSADPEIRASAARVLGKLKDQSSLAFLVRLLDDPIWFVRAAAARALGFLPSNVRSLRALGAKLTDSTWWVRANAARALAQQGEVALDTLLNAVEGPNAYARDAALAALSLAGLLPAAIDRLNRILAAAAGDSR